MVAMVIGLLFFKTTTLEEKEFGISRISKQRKFAYEIAINQSDGNSTINETRSKRQQIQLFRL